MAHKEFPNYDNVFRELCVLEQFQDGQCIYIKGMHAHNEYCSLDDCILEISRYKDKSPGYGIHQEDKPRAALARSHATRSMNDLASAQSTKELFATVSLIGDDIKLVRRWMSDTWLDLALAIVE